MPRDACCTSWHQNVCSVAKKKKLDVFSKVDRLYPWRVGFSNVSALGSNGKDSLASWTTEIVAVQGNNKLSPKPAFWSEQMRLKDYWWLIQWYMCQG